MNERMFRTRRNMILSLAPAIMLAFFLRGCASRRWVTVPQYDTATGSTQPSSYEGRKRPEGEIAPGNTVTLRSSDPKVNGTYSVGFDGSLKLPYNVKVSTAGMNEDRLAEAVRGAYRPYFKSPGDIRVEVDRRSYLVQVQGLVHKPGQYTVKEDDTLDSLIAQAGGLMEGSGPDQGARYVRITGTGGTGMIRLGDYYSGAKGLDPQWRGGETVFFQSQGGGGGSKTGQRSVHLLGQVKNPAEYVAESRGDLFQYLIRAGGPTDRADLDNVSLVRADANGTKAMNFSMYDMENIPEIMPGDAVIFNADNDSPLEKKSRIGASFANIISAIGIIIIAAAG